MRPAPKRDEVWLVALDPVRGAEIQKTRPCLIVSPDDLNRHIHAVIVAPMTTVTRQFPSRVPVHFRKKDGQIALDQIRAVGSSRLVKKLGTVSESTAKATSAVLVEMFSRG